MIMLNILFTFVFICNILSIFCIYILSDSYNCSIILKKILSYKGNNMKAIVSKYLALSALGVFILTSNSFAAEKPNLPKSKQEKASTGDEIEIIPEITIQSNGATQTNPKLKKGKGCDFSDLEEAELEPYYGKEIPMAETIPCDKVNCDDLRPATLKKDLYKPLPLAKTVAGCDK